MSINRLWAPWRLAYVQAKKNSKGCIFCKAGSRRSGYVFFQTKHAIAMLNIFPYNNGHVMVAPRRHVRNLGNLTDVETLDLFSAVTRAQKLIDKILKPQGYNIGINLGRASGAGIPGHLHIHIVPRWVGDVNFMPVATGTKVISQSLDELLKLLKNAQSGTD